MQSVKIASLQLKVLEDKYDNIEKLAELVADGAAKGADIISLPEIWNSPYQTDLFPVNAEPEQGDSWLAMSTIARKNGVYMVGGSIPFTYEPNTCQLSFSRDRKEFRAHTDNMSDFYAVRFTELPTIQGQTVTADLTWTTERDVLTRKNLTLEVVRIEGDQFWLWSNSGRIGLCIRILE